MNKVYIRDGDKLNKEFAAVSRSVFDSELQNINFLNSKEAAAEINTWVSIFDLMLFFHILIYETYARKKN